MSKLIASLKDKFSVWDQGNDIFWDYCQPGIAFGCEQLGGYEWGDIDIIEVESAINSAIEHGIKMFDTADCYGKGLSEKRLGKILRQRRSDVCIATKYGVKFSTSGVHYDSSPRWAVTALEASLKRLKTDYIDLFQMHYWDGITSLDDVIDQLDKFVESGKIRAYGFTNIVNLPSKYCKNDNFRTISFEYSLANRGNELNAKNMAGRGFTFLSYGSLGQGVLTGKYKKTSVFSKNDRRSRPEYMNFHGSHLDRNINIVTVLEKWSGRLGISIPKLALSWIRSTIEGSVPIVGFKNPQQLEGALGLNEIKLSDEFMEELDQVSTTE